MMLTDCLGGGGSRPIHGGKLECDSSEDEDDEVLGMDSTMPLIEDSHLIERIRAKRRIQVFNIIALSVVAMLTAMCLPLHYNDRSNVILEGNKLSTDEDTLFFSYVALLVSAMVGCFLAPMWIPFLGTKTTLVFGTVVTCCVIAGHFVPEQRHVLIPLYSIGGFLLSGYYTTQVFCIATLGLRYAGTRLDGGSHMDTILLVFNGVFSMFQLSGPVWRAVLQLLILQPNIEVEHGNASIAEVCGISFCASNTVQTPLINDEEYGVFKVQAYLGSLLTVGLTSIIIAAACLQIPHRLDWRGRVAEVCAGLAKASSKAWTMDYALLVPLFIYTGAQQSLLYQVISTAYIRCMTNDTWLAYFIMCVSSLSLLASFPLALVARYLSRTKLTILALILQFTLLAVLLTVQPSKANLTPLFAIGGAWGMADAVLQTQIGVILGTLYPRPQLWTFAIYRFWEIGGMLVIHLQFHYLCVGFPLLLVIGFSLMALCMYVTMEIRTRLLAQERRITRTDSITWNSPDMEYSTWLPELDPLDRHRQKTQLTLLHTDSIETDED